MKILTFVIPAYNSERFLDKCISSMIDPLILDKLEIIVVNDGSTDQTIQIVEKYCVRYPKTVRLISQKNKGHGGALNTGCLKAKGKYLKVIDADDWVETQNLQEFIEFLQLCDSDVVLTHYRTFDVSNGEEKEWKCSPEKFSCVYTLDEIINNWKNFEKSMTFHGETYRTAFYKESGIQLPEHVFYEDHEYATFPCCKARNVIAVDTFIYDYRIGDVNQSVSNSNQLKRIKHFEIVIQHMIEEYKKLPQNAGKKFAAIKIQSVVLSYLTTVLLINPDKKAGRILASRMMKQCQISAIEVYRAVRWKCLVFLLMNRLHISKETWDNIVKSKYYHMLKNIL